MRICSIIVGLAMLGCLAGCDSQESSIPTSVTPDQEQALQQQQQEVDVAERAHLQSQGS